MSIPAPLRGLVDDAAVFPPGSASLDDALRAHDGYRRSRFAGLVGPLVLGADLLPALVERVEAQSPVEPLRIVVVAAADAVEDAVRQVAGPAGVAVAALEVRLDPAASGSAQVAQLAADRHDLVDDGALDAGATVVVEVPRPPAGSDSAWDGLLEALRDHGFRLKFRTGGVTADAFPSEDEVTRWVLAARDLGVPFKCTAGLHDAARHTAHDTGFEHHGYLNVLLAATLAAGGGDADAVRAAVAERDPHALAGQVRDAREPALLAGRELFTSYGSCSVLEPLQHLVDLGLVDAGTARTEPVEEPRA